MCLILRVNIGYLFMKWNWSKNWASVTITWIIFTIILYGLIMILVFIICVWFNLILINRRYVLSAIETLPNLLNRTQKHIILHYCFIFSNLPLNLLVTSLTPFPRFTSNINTTSRLHAHIRCSWLLLYAMLLILGTFVFAWIYIFRHDILLNLIVFEMILIINLRLWYIHIFIEYL